MKTWFQLSEEEYMEFGASTEATVRMRIARGSFKLQNSFCDSKAKVLCDLAFQALDFSFISNLAYNSLCALLYVLSEELCHILNNHKDIESTPRRRFASSVDNYKKVHDSVPPDEMKLIMKFHAERLLQIGRLIEYVLLHLPEEEEKEVQLEVMTPVVPVSLSGDDSLSSHNAGL